MFTAVAKHTVKSDLTDKLKKSLADLAKMDVFVGIPQGEIHPGTNLTNAQLLYIQEHGVRNTEMRKEMQPKLDDGIPYSKAHQLYIHEHGSPLWQIPPRPVLAPAIASVKPLIAKQFKLATLAALEGKDPMPYLEAAGQIGKNAAFRWFTNPNNGWAPNSPVTIHGSKPDKSGKKFIKGKQSDRPLIDTGDMRRSITFVVRKRP